MARAEMSDMKGPTIGAPAETSGGKGPTTVTWMKRRAAGGDRRLATDQVMVKEEDKANLWKEGFPIQIRHPKL
jgi:hypothetical protein